jgi:hypothetical protein
MTPKMVLVCTGFAVRTDSGEIPSELLVTFLRARSAIPPIRNQTSNCNRVRMIGTFRPFHATNLFIGCCLRHLFAQPLPRRC